MGLEDNLNHTMPFLGGRHVIKQTTVGDCLVSTISLEAMNRLIDKTMREQGLPGLGEDVIRDTADLLGRFETMVFDGSHKEVESFRANTAAEALDFHDSWVEALKLNDGPPAKHKT